MEHATVEDPRLVAVGDLDRSSYIGGSDIAALLGVDPYKTPLDVWNAKMGHAPMRPPSDEQMKRMKRGKRLEPVVLESVQDEYDVEIVGRNRRYRDAQHPFLAAEIDYEWRPVGSTEVHNGEIKTVHPLSAKQWGEANSGDVPIWYAAQSLFGLMITGRSRCDYAVLFGADDLTPYVVERDEQMIATMREVAVNFWMQNVQKQVPPPPRSFEDLKALWPQDTGSMFAADGLFKLLVEQLQMAKEAEARAADAVEKARFDVVAAIKDASGALYEGKKLVTYKAQKQTRLDTTAFKREQPELYAKYAHDTEFRVLRIMG